MNPADGRSYQWPMRNTVVHWATLIEGIAPGQYLRPLDIPLVHAELMPQRQILCLKGRAGLEKRQQQSKVWSDELQHGHSDGVPKKGVSARPTPWQRDGWVCDGSHWGGD